MAWHVAGERRDESGYMDVRSIASPVLTRSDRVSLHCLLYFLFSARSLCVLLIMAYLAPIHQASSIRHALKLNFLSRTEECLVVAYVA